MVYTMTILGAVKRLADFSGRLLLDRVCDISSRTLPNTKVPAVILRIAAKEAPVRGAQLNVPLQVYKSVRGLGLE